MKKQFILFMLLTNLSTLSRAMEEDPETYGQRIKSIKVRRKKTSHFKNI